MSSRHPVSAVLFVLVLSSIVPFVVADDSDSSSSEWLVSECNRMTAEYTDGATVLYVHLDDNPGGYSSVAVSLDGKTFTAQGQNFGINMGVALDRSMPHMVVVTATGISASCKLTYGLLYDVTVVSSPQEGGTVSGAGRYTVGSQVTLTATPSEGHSFGGWAYDGKLVSSQPTYVFNVEMDVEYTARWFAVPPGSDTVIIDLIGHGDSFVAPVCEGGLFVAMRENASVKIDDASSISGKTVVSKVEDVSTTAQTKGTAHSYEFTFTADGSSYGGKMQVTLPYLPENGTAPAVYYQDGDSLVKMNLLSSNEISVTFETDHNSTYVVVAEPTDSGFPIIYAAIGAAAALALLGAVFIIRRKH